MDVFTHRFPPPISITCPHTPTHPNAHERSIDLRECLGYDLPNGLLMGCREVYGRPWLLLIPTRKVPQNDVDFDDLSS
jgi:hypothetical protein